jgi:ABC-type lipoprotein export system ATPase subunit
MSQQEVFALLLEYVQASACLMLLVTHDVEITQPVTLRHIA